MEDIVDELFDALLPEDWNGFHNGAKQQEAYHRLTKSIDSLVAEPLKLSQEAAEQLMKHFLAYADLRERDIFRSGLRFGLRLLSVL